MAQNIEKSDKRPCPRFIIDKLIGQLYEENFVKYYDKFIDYADLPLVFIKKGQFLKLLKRVISEDGTTDYTVNGFRVYLGQEARKIRFIFTGLRDDVDIEEYFTIDNIGNLVEINYENALQLVKNYARQTAIPYTNSVIGGNTNTLSYIFNNGLVYDILSEVSRQKNNRDIIGLNFKLGAFDESNPNYSKRILIGFTFVKKDRSEIYLQDLPDNTYGCEFDARQAYNELKDLFSTRQSKIKPTLSPTEKQVIAIANFKAINGDTGTPCPPGTNCGTASLQP